MRSLDDEYPTLAGARRELRADVLERRAVEKCAERAADMGLVADAEMFARALAGLPRTRELLGRTALPAPVVAVVGKPGDTHLAVDGKRFARLWRVGEEGVVVERLVGFADIPDVLIAAALASVVVDGTTSPEETVPVGIAFLDSDRACALGAVAQARVDGRGIGDETAHLGSDRCEFRNRQIRQRRLEGAEALAAPLAQDGRRLDARQRRIDAD